MSSKLVACPSCSCHALPDETECPHCGAALRLPDGTVPRTALAALMGLSTMVASCVVTVYGPGPTGGTGGDGGNIDTSSSSSGQGGMGGQGGTGGSAGQAGMGGAGGSGGK